MSSLNIVTSLEMTFGKIPELIYDQVKYITYNITSDDFLCVPCDKSIKICKTSKKNTTNNFCKHFGTKTHKSNTITVNELLKNLNNTFDNKIPQIVCNNLNVLSMKDRFYECAICEKIIPVSSDGKIMEENFSYHLMGAIHKDNMEKYEENLSQLNDVYGIVPFFISCQKQFLTKNGKHYFCTICEKYLVVHPTDLDETEENFRKHLASIKHLRNAKQAKAFSILPELRNIFSYLPSHMIRNIQYISMNGPNFFCSLCCENIKYNRQDLYQTEQNLKFHNLSPKHEKYLNYRRNPDNGVFERLHEVFETFPDSVLDNLKYISIDGSDFYCTICKEVIVEGEDTAETEDNLISHFDSLYHESIVDDKFERQSEVIEELENLFGYVPQSIQDNIEHIKFIGGIKFECVLCNMIFNLKNGGFEKHFVYSKKHKNKLENIEAYDADLETSLESLFTCTPQYIINNLTHISQEEDSEDFHCDLCDEIICVVYGTKKEELTKQNFRTHLLSSGHVNELKNVANVKMIATEQLELIYNSVPHFILNNVEHLEKLDNHFCCTVCDVQIMRGESHFRSHLYGTCHKSKIKEIMDDHDVALQRFDYSFWRLPEFLLRSIDFLYTADEDLFCSLCQIDLPIDEENLTENKEFLRQHFDGDKHRDNLQRI